MTSATRRSGPRTYALAWAVGGAAAVVATVTLLGLPSLGPAVGLLVLVTAMSDLAEVELRTSRTTTAFSLLEAAVAANILLLAVPEALTATLAGAFLAQLVRAPELRKLTFNCGQIAMASSVAVVIAHVGAVQPGVLTWRSVAVVAISMAAYTVVNVVAMVGLIARQSSRPAWDAVRAQGRLLVATVGGNVMVGCLAVSQWLNDPTLIVLLAGPVAAVYLSSRGAVQTRELLDHVREDRDLLEHIVIGATDGIAFIDDEDTIQVWNPAMARITGVPTGTVLGNPAAGVLGDIETRRDLLAGPDDDRHGSIVEGLIGRPDGSRIAVTVARGRVRRAEGERRGSVVVVHDVTQQREVAALREHFVARVSHELRSPLTPIRGFAQTLLDADGHVDPARRRRALEAIVERADHMARLVEDLLQVTRPADAEGDGEPMSVTTVDVRDPVGRAVRWAREEAPERTVRFEPPGTPCGTRVDELRLVQVVTNLLGNAIKYAPPGSPIDVTVQRQAGGPGWEIQVCDRGPGIPQDKREAIFEAFQRLEDPLTMRTGGVGLGLYLARRFTLAMGGQLAVEARCGDGSVFTIRLPAVPHLAAA